MPPSSTDREAEISYLGQEEAVEVDKELMGPLGFSVDQLMELAGLSVACSIADVYPPAQAPRVAVICGPGNNGGDGLVAARHLYHFGYTVQVCYPKPTSKPLFDGLVTQCRSLGIGFVTTEELLQGPMAARFDLVVDAMFGFSFKGSPRPPFDAILAALSPAASPPRLACVDIPSGWHVEDGDQTGVGLRPDMLISLTAPKRGARGFSGAHHYLGGRFVPPAVVEKYHLRLPPFPGSAQCVRIGGSAAQRGTAADRELLEDGAGGDPMELFRRWFAEAEGHPLVGEAHAMCLATAGSDARPSARQVLLKGFGGDGFKFLTNSVESRKGRDVAGNNRAALCFYWQPLGRSVRVEGLVERLPRAEAEEHFARWPRSAKVGAAASRQSEAAGSRHELEARAAELDALYGEDAAVEVPCPPEWGGYLVRPVLIEFWQRRSDHIHDRLCYTREAPGEGWEMRRLAP